MSEELNQNEQTGASQGGEPGRKSATVALVLGILGLVFSILVPIIGLILSIIGLVFASKAKKEGFVGGMRTAGFVLSLIGLILAIIIFVVSIAFVGAIGVAALAGQF